MNDQNTLSQLARDLLRLHQADYQPGVGGKQDYKQIRGRSDDDISTAYRELEEAEWLERTGSVASINGMPRPYYKLTQKGKEGIG